MSRTNYKVEFTGHSDDIISVKKTRHVHYCDAQGDSLHEDEDEISADSSDKTVIRVQNIGGSRCCNVIAFYDGTWSFAVSMVEESRKIPPWNFTIDQPDHAYSTRLVIESDEDELVVDDLRDKEDDED